MSWWQEELAQTLNSPLWTGAGFAGAAAYLRIKLRGQSHGWTADIGEALACALISTMITQCVQIFFPAMPETVAMPIGTFTGWIGSRAMTQALMQVFTHFLPKDKAAETEKAEESGNDDLSSK